MSRPASGTVVFYVSAHGFGHAVRQIEIINALERWPDIAIVVRSAAPPWLFERSLRRPARLEPFVSDTGVRQIDSLRLDADRTIDDAALFYADLPTHAAREADWLVQTGASLVLADAPPLACAAAAQADVPCVVVGNFTWDWIYEAYEGPLRRHPWLVPAIADAYARATHAWRLPMWGGFGSIGEVTDVPFVARRSVRTRAETRAAFGLPDTGPVALVSFGGYGLPRASLPHVDAGEFALVTVSSGHGDVDVQTADGRVTVIPETSIHDRGFRYEDLVLAVDVVVTKPGYGIISECIANHSSILYTSRGDFAEYDRLTREMPRYLACEYIDHADLFGGRWAASLDRLRARPAPSVAPRTDGAAVIADLVRAHLT